MLVKFFSRVFFCWTGAISWRGPALPQTPDGHGTDGRRRAVRPYQPTKGIHRSPGRQICQTGNSQRAGDVGEGELSTSLQWIEGGAV